MLVNSPHQNYFIFTYFEPENWKERGKLQKTEDLEN